MVHPSSRTRLESALRALQLQAGAVANAADAVRADRRTAAERGVVTSCLAELAGPASWAPVVPVPVADRCHAVVGYDGDAGLLSRLASYVVQGLVAGEVCVVMATATHLSGLRRRLSIGGVATRPGLLVELDAEQVLSSFVADGWPDSGLFDLHVADVLRSHAERGGRLRAFGEMVGLLVARDDIPAALHLEKLWDALQLQLRFPLLCAYPARALAGLDDDTAARVRARHTHVAPAFA